MSDLQRLTALRIKLVSRRRSLVNALDNTPTSQLTGDTIARIQNAIDAVDRAILDERDNPETYSVPSE